MGLTASKLFNQLFGFNKPTRILLLGLDAAGKTTVLYKLKMGELVTTIPTIGFNVETIQHKNLEMTIWDVGGQDKIRQLWKHYYENTDALIFLVVRCDHSYSVGHASRHRFSACPMVADCCLRVAGFERPRPHRRGEGRAASRDG